MKRSFFMTLVPVLALLAVSCDDLSKSDDPYEGLDSKTFWALDMKKGTYYQTEAVRLYAREKCVIWGERSAQIDLSTAEAIAYEYDTKIYSPIVGTFGFPEVREIDTEKLIGNSLDVADYLTDGDGKLTILLLDIRDGYQNRTDSYTAGYFSSENFYDTRSSNKADMIYVDTYPAVPGSSESNATFAHELQHLINFINTQITRDYLMDTWIDEGLSSAAEFIYQGTHPEMRYRWFIEDPSGAIAKGNNFFVWGNHQETNAIMDEYATVYLFFQWLRLQAGTYKIYNDIATSDKYDYQAVLEAVQNNASMINQYDDWEKLMGTWLAANYINAPSGRYGYKNENKLREVRVWAIGGNSQPLYPGEGVYSIINSSKTVSGPGNIRYGGLKKDSAPTFNAENNTYSGERLLTFNSNASIEGGPEPGTLTGAPAESKPSASSAISRQAWQAPGPLQIDARDIAGNREREQKNTFRSLGEKGTYEAK
jgi:hypothetical protein